MKQYSLNTSGSKFLLITARILSYLFHPLFLPTFVFFWMSYRFPYLFAGMSVQGLLFRKITVFWTTAFFPAVAVFLLSKLQFVDSIYLKTQKDRIIPYIITMFFYWWIWYLSRSFTDQPSLLKPFYFGIFLTTIFGLIINNFIKISLHTIGAGSVAAFSFIACLHYQRHLGADIAICLILSGVIGSARLVNNSHNSVEIYSGYLVGILCQVLGYFLMVES